MNNEPRLSPFMRTIALIVALLVPLGTAPVSLQAATYYWDTNDTASGFGTAAGTWSTTTIGTTTMGWSTSSAGTDTVNGNSVTTANTNNTTDAINFGSGATGLSAGTITVTGTVAAGDMTFASGSGAIVLSGGTINLAATSTITVDNTSDTISSILAGAGTSLIKTGTGTLTLSGTNTFTGQLTVQNGTLSIATINNDSAVGTLGNSTSSVILGNTGAQTGTLQYTGGTASSTKKFTMATGGTGAFDVTGGATTLTLSGLIDGSGSLTKNGVGTLLLSNTANTYVGATTINGGILQVAALGGGSSNSSEVHQHTKHCCQQRSAGFVDPDRHWRHQRNWHFGVHHRRQRHGSEYHLADQERRRHLVAHRH
ncbi:MAG: autotransporter-associated beta strand repeat-containing protein [Verrucomicrobia bacterium]|nr:autotransporter-associated beta strand repeat-containing protein [Verrucomicrobiota bacterium]